MLMLSPRRRAIGFGGPSSISISMAPRPATTDDPELDELCSCVEAATGRTGPRTPTRLAGRQGDRLPVVCGSVLCVWPFEGCMV